MIIYILYFCLILFALCLVCLMLLGAFLILVRLRTKWNTSPVCLVGKTVIVTGANSGIGYCTAHEFATRGAKVILACRSMSRAEKAKRKMMEATQNRNIHVRIVDFASLKSIREFVKEVKESEERLDILVNNAGAILNDETTVDGLSKTIQVNGLGPFLLTLLLLDLMKKSKSSRIVNVASLTIYYAKIDINNLNYYSKSIFSRISIFNYANAKLCNLILMNDLARRLKGTGVIINSVDPGLVYTGIGRRFTAVGKILFVCVQLFLRSSREGAQSSIYAALSRRMEQVTGKYIMNSKITWVPSIANNELFAKELWEKCLSVLQITNEERLIIQKI
ncbi:hypothetical protein RI129_007581 [Pyrocoelia pectoralis]|uniref:Uncharacterized protein n=1 Tax=Pyrocoelia pectoralis TaxID=417401 RepID=A0AAN7VDV3_9COLE